MKVYVAMRGLYSDKHLGGVYASLERAKAALPGQVWKQEEDAQAWWNELDWDDFAEITEMEVIDK